MAPFIPVNIARDKIRIPIFKFEKSRGYINYLNSVLPREFTEILLVYRWTILRAVYNSGKMGGLKFPCQNYI
jgi:hypothetical protein